MKTFAAFLFPVLLLFTQSVLADYGYQGKPLNLPKPKYEQVGTYTFYTVRHGLHSAQQCEDFKKESGLCGFWSEYKCGPCERTHNGTHITYLDIFKKL